MLKIDVELMPHNLKDIAELAAKAEEFGFDGIFVNETKHDPFIQAAVAALNTKKAEIGTSIAVAFARSPALPAYSSWDLQILSGGRFILGLGSQVKGHIERRFGMKWESPVKKMREYIGVIRSLWNNWQYGEKLDFRGNFYVINLMTDFFNPGRIEHPSIPIYLACVNKRMARLAGEVCEGVHIHPLHTKKYLEEEIIPSVEEGMKKAGKSKVTLAASCFAAVGTERGQIKDALEIIRKNIAFYASTRTYMPVMEKHGLGQLCEELHSLSLEGKWDRMARLISDDVLDLFVVSGDFEDIAGRIRERYNGYVDRVRLYMPFDGREEWKKLVAKFKS